MNDIKQFKLTSGEEVVCDVVEWPDEESTDVVVRHAYRVFVYAETNDGSRIYSMRPWMLLQDVENSVQLININHIVGETTPSAKMIEQYVKIVTHTEFDQELSTEDLTTKLAEHINNIRSMSLSNQINNDSDGNNIVRFPGGRALH